MIFNTTKKPNNHFRSEISDFITTFSCNVKKQYRWGQGGVDDRLMPTALKDGIHDITGKRHTININDKCTPDTWKDRTRS